MFRKLSVTVVLVFGLVAALVVQTDSVRAESMNTPVTVPVTAPISNAIRVTGRVLYKYWGQTRPAVGASVVVRNARGMLVTIVTTDSAGRYAVQASGNGYYVFRPKDNFGTVFYPSEKWFKAGVSQDGVDFVGKRKP